MRIVTIRNPQAAVVEGVPDNPPGSVYDVTAQVAILMIAAGWARSETRSRDRRQFEQETSLNRRHRPDRRSVVA